MPTYEYLCKCCGKQFEEEQSIKDDPKAACPTCKVYSHTRLISGGGAFVLKGSGWASDNYSSTKKT